MRKRAPSGVAANNGTQDAYGRDNRKGLYADAQLQSRSELIASRHELEAVRARLDGFVKSGQLGIFTNGYWGHPAMRLTPEVNLIAVAHYLQALDVQRKATQAVAILGGKTPNVQNLVVGGVANAVDLDSPAALNMEKLYQVKTLVDEVSTFVQQCVRRARNPRCSPP